MGTNLQYGGIMEAVTSTVTSGGTTTLTNTSSQVQTFTGTLGQTVTLPNATTYSSNGAKFEIYNASSGIITLNYNGGALLNNIPAGTTLIVKLTNNSTSAGTWVSSASGVTNATSTYNVTSQTSNYNASVSDYVVCSGSSFTVTLPTAVGQSGKNIRVQSNGSNFTSYTIHTTSSQTITNKGTTFTDTDINTNNLFSLQTSGEIFEFISDGSNWTVSFHETETPWTSGSYVLHATGEYSFTIASSTVSFGAVYSNNGQTFTVTASITSQTTLTCFGTGTPTTSGTLTLVSGTGPSTISFSARTISLPAKGTITTDSIIWKRRGSNMMFQFNYQQTGAGTQGTGNYIFTLPGNVSFDSTVLLNNNTTTAWSTRLGSGTLSNGSNGTGTPSWPSTVYPYDSTHFGFLGFSLAGTGNTVFHGSGAFGYVNANMTFFNTGEFQVSGWLP